VVTWNGVTPQPAFEPDFAAIVGGYHGAPFDVLGIHPAVVDGRAAMAVRTFQPQAAGVVVKRGCDSKPAARVHPDGLFEAVFPGAREPFDYRLVIALSDDGGSHCRCYEIDDPYRFKHRLCDRWSSGGPAEETAEWMAVTTGPLGISARGGCR
jgi:hypothetical protein